MIGLIVGRRAPSTHTYKSNKCASFHSSWSIIVDFACSSLVPLAPTPGSTLTLTHYGERRLQDSPHMYLCPNLLAISTSSKGRSRCLRLSTGRLFSPTSPTLSAVPPPGLTTALDDAGNLSSNLLLQYSQVVQGSGWDRARCMMRVQGRKRMIGPFRFRLWSAPAFSSRRSLCSITSILLNICLDEVYQN